MVTNCKTRNFYTTVRIYYTCSFNLSSYFFVFSFSKFKEETVRSSCEYYYAQLFNALEWEKELVYRRQQEVCNLKRNLQIKAF